jgi:uncharacterized protein (TIGR02246 family)
MKTKLILSGSAALFALALACAARAAGTRSTDEQAIRDLDAQWSAAAGAKDVDKVVSYYADDAVVFPPNAPSAATTEAIRTAWREMLTTPGAAISWKATKVEVAKSGDMAYSTGTYQLAMNDPTGKPIYDRGKYVEVWKKKADGKWKVAVDIWNSDLPLPSPEKK